MREIKFRAWDKTTKRMMDLSEFIYDAESEAVYMFFTDLENRIKRSYDHDGEDASDRFVLMQSTGLKDKNGVEMYFEDIAKATFCCAVCFDNEPHELIGHIDQLDSGEWVLDYGHGSISLDALEDIEVIGNIYENPELMEGK